MDPPLLTPTTADFYGGPPSSPPPKLRLMCSYGGHIVPHPRDNSVLLYAGGDTRIVAVDRRNTTMSSLLSHLSLTLFNNRPFNLKYQLPDSDLDSLISVSTDEDLHHMLEEHDRISGCPAPSRIRLFLFPVNDRGSPVLDMKAESWFYDALNGARIAQKTRLEDDPGLVKQGSDCSNSGSVPESIVLETSSSFGSTDSPVLMSNLPVIGMHCEDGGVGWEERKVRLPSSASTESESSIGGTSFPPKVETYHEPINQVASVALPYSAESESTSGLSSGIQMQKTNQVSGYPLPQPSERNQYLQEVQYVNNGAYVPSYSGGQYSVTSFYPLYQMPIQQQQHCQVPIQQQQHCQGAIQQQQHCQVPIQQQRHCQVPIQQQQHCAYSLNQPSPFYLVPLQQTQSYTTTMPCNLNAGASIASSQSSLHTQSTMVAPAPLPYKDIATAQTMVESVANKNLPVTTIHTQNTIVTPPSPSAYKEIMTTQPIPNTVANRMIPVSNPMVSITSNQNQEQMVGNLELQLSHQLAAATNEFDEDLRYTQIYKTQPSAPAFASQCQAMMNSPAVLLSEPMQLHANNVTSQAAAHPQ